MWRHAHDFLVCFNFSNVEVSLECPGLKHILMTFFSLCRWRDLRVSDILRWSRHFFPRDPWGNSRAVIASVLPVRTWDARSISHSGRAKYGKEKKVECENLLRKLATQATMRMKFIQLDSSSPISTRLHRFRSRLHPRGGGVLPDKFGRGVRPVSQNPYPIYDQHGGEMAKIDTQFMTKTAEKSYPLGPHIPI